MIVLCKICNNQKTHHKSRTCSVCRKGVAQDQRFIEQEYRYESVKLREAVVVEYF